MNRRIYLWFWFHFFYRWKSKELRDRMIFGWRLRIGEILCWHRNIKQFGNEGSDVRKFFGFMRICDGCGKLFNFNAPDTRKEG